MYVYCCTYVCTAVRQNMRMLLLLAAAVQKSTRSLAGTYCCTGNQSNLLSKYLERGKKKRQQKTYQ